MSLPPSKHPKVEEWVAELQKVWEGARKALQWANELMKRYHDKGVSKAVEYQKGDLVWVDGANISKSRPTKKLEDHRYGPFTIIKKRGASAYLLDLPLNWKQRLTPIFNESILSPFRPPIMELQKMICPLLEIVNDHLEYKVEKIHDKRTRGWNTWCM